jgi:hypothetical protein
MGFDKERFLGAGFIPRTSDLQVPDLAEFFWDGSEAVWKVRGLKGIEVAQANDAVEKYKNVSGLIGKILGGTDKEKIEAAIKAMGYDGATPADVVKRLEYLRVGSVDPVVDWDLASRLCEYFPIEFYQITNEILTLTGRGHVPGKQNASGGTTESTQA